ncbi:PREDICTED: putative fidgetin-like protein 2 [Pseudopodoces humilis]|uniref:putative fidgetin-like protein 2 n=1 Tax=Pseudopodoces humilis TaxID=181119 RepID=UPI0003959509|nr:PREDICTED: putative fidgetin-like protein 2 [Pseudopodoces humilis]
MHWSPEHAQSLNQWPEQHLDVSSTTSSPAHKSDLYPSTRQRFNYAWANDDISALTASNLLKRYAEKYSGVLDAPYERPTLAGYGDGAFGPVNGQKGDGEPWPGGSDGSYPLAPIADGLAKGSVPPAVPAGSGAMGLGGSPVLPSLSEPVYAAGNSCGAAAAGSGPLGAAQEYPSAYGGTYLPSGYCTQPAAALPPPHPPALHSSGLLQPAHPSPALVPGYGSSGPVYNYTAGSYAPQPGYGGIHPPHPSAASYLPSGIAAPTPIPAPPPPARPPGVPGYGYQGAALGSLAVPPLGTEAAGTLKRKAFDIGGEDDGEGRYRKYSYEQPKSPYPLSDNGECRGNGFGGGGDSPQVPFKAGKPPAAGSAEEHGGKYGGQQMKGMASPPYGSRDAALRPAEPFEKFSPPLANGERTAEPGPPFPLRLPPKALGFAPLEEQPKNVDPLVLELVNTKVVERGPPVQWSDIAGQAGVKAAIEEELLWPILRPGSYSGASHPLRTLLLFGPRGTGKSLLGRCVSTQLGSTLLRLSGAALLSTWKAEAEKILQTVFLVASCRQPSVVLITEAESLLAARPGEDGGQAGVLKSQLLSYLDDVATSSEQNVVVIGTTARPGSIDEASHRRFGTRLYIPPPDGEARRQILRQALARQSCCLSERELAALAQRTESFSCAELLRLCQHAGAARRALPGPPTSYQDLEKALCKVRPGVSQKELDLFLDWDKMYGTRH